MPVRVLRVIARMNVGGPAIHASLLTTGLDPSRYESRLVTGKPAPGEGDYLELHGQRLADVISIPDLGREIHPWRDLFAYRQLVAIMREFRPDIVHTHTAKAGLLGRLAARRAGVPVVIHTFHGHVLRGYFSRYKEEAFVRAERRAAQWTTRLVTVSEVVRDEILALGVGRPEQFEVIRLGFDLAPFQTAEQHAGSLREELGVEPATPIVGIVARLVPIKAHEVFLDMAALVTRANPETVFLIVGDGERHAWIDTAARARGIPRAGTVSGLARRSLPDLC